jgi:hypothetical protein
MGENRRASFELVRDRETMRARPHLHLVPDTLETLLTRVVATLRSSLTDGVPAGFASACRRDAIAVIDAGHAAGLLQMPEGLPTNRE